MSKQKSGKNSNRKIEAKTPRKIQKPTDDQEYGLILKCLGGSRFSVKLQNGKTVIAKLRGKLRSSSKKKWNVDVDVIVLLSTRDFQENVVDIISVFDNNECRQLRKQGIFSVTDNNEDIHTESVVLSVEDDCGFEFDDI